MSLYPTSLASFAGFTSSHTLVQDNHAAQSNSEQAEIIATQTKIGTGASTPTSGLLLRGTGVGTSSWAQANLTSDVTGVLPQANGGTGTTAAAGTGSAVYATSPTISGPSLTGGGSWTGSPSFTTPTIADFTNSGHNHQNAAGGGTLNAGNALQAATLTAGIVGTDSSWAWTTFTPAPTGYSVNPTVNTARYIQIGKVVYMQIDFTGGTSNATTLTFTLPVAPKNAGSAMAVAIAGGSGGQQSSPSFISWSAASTTASATRNLDTTVWATSGTKGIQNSCIIYEAQ